MAGAVNPDGWASSLGVSNDDDAVGVVEDLRARVQGHADTVGRLQDRVRSSPGDVSVLLRQAVFLLDSAADELVKVQGRVCPPRTRSPLMRARVEVMSDVLVSVCQPFAAVVWSVRRSLPAAALAPPGPGRGERALQRHPTSGTPNDCTTKCDGCPAHPAARTGCDTASPPNTPARTRPLASASRLHTTGRTSAPEAAGSWSPGSGPARPSPNTGQTGAPSSPKSSPPPGSIPATQTGSPPTKPCLTAHIGTSGKTPKQVRSTTSPLSPPHCGKPASDANSTNGPNTSPRNAVHHLWRPIRQ